MGETLASFKVPVHVSFTAELPYTASGKVVKHEVEQQLASELGKA